MPLQSLCPKYDNVKVDSHKFKGFCTNDTINCEEYKRYWCPLITVTNLVEDNKHVGTALQKNFNQFVSDKNVKTNI
jgi:hypothetical protein